MPSKKHQFILTIFLIIIVCINLFDARAVLADGETPTEPAAPATESPTDVAVASTPEPAEATATPVAEALTQVPEGTEVVVLNESGDAVPLATAEAAEITGIIDPMWCPEGVLPGGPGCSTNFATISALVNSMRNNASLYDENGIIYFTSSAGGSLTLTDTGTSLGSSYDLLKKYNLTLRGGWDGVSTSFSGQTNFGTSPITIGTNSNPWVGNLTLKDIVFNSSSSTSLTVYSSTGDITLENVDVNNQGNAKNTAVLSSSSGDINITNGTYDGNGSNSSGLSATTSSGSIAISNSSFTDNIRPSTTTADGATLSAPIVTLLNVTATNNDGSGVFFTGSSLYINSGAFNSNQRYGIEVASPANTTIYVPSDPTCSANTLGCYNDATISDNTAPIITPNISGTLGLNGWYTSDVSISWSVTDSESGILSSTGCVPSDLTTNTAGTTLTCSAANKMGLSNSVSVTIKIDKTVTVVTPVPTGTAEATSTPPSTLGSPSSSTSSSALVIPLTGDELVNINCNSVFWAFGIKLSFFNLCDHETTVSSIDMNNLPGKLPDGMSFVQGLNVSILSQNQAIEKLPTGSSIQIDFPIPAGSSSQFAALHWNGSAWTEVAPQANQGQGAYQVITTDNVGIFVLVKK